MGAEGAVSVEMGWPGPGQPLHGTGCRVRGTTTAGSGGAAGAGRGGGCGACLRPLQMSFKLTCSESLNLGSAWSLTVPHSCSFLQ